MVPVTCAILKGMFGMHGRKNTWIGKLQEYQTMSCRFLHGFEMQELYNIVVWMLQNNLLEIVFKREKEIEKMVIRSFIGDRSNLF